MEVKLGKFSFCILNKVRQNQLMHSGDKNGNIASTLAHFHRAECIDRYNGLFVSSGNR